jgi:hypothetical protein
MNGVTLDSDCQNHVVHCVTLDSECQSHVLHCVTLCPSLMFESTLSSFATLPFQLPPGIFFICTYKKIRYLFSSYR